MAAPDKQLEELFRQFQDFLQQDGRLKFMVDSTGVPADRVERIHELGRPWPIDQEFSRLVAAAEAMGKELTAYLLGLAPLIDESYRLEEKKLQDLQAAISRGESPDLPLEHKEFADHLQSVASRSGEEVETVIAVHEAYHAYNLRLNELVSQIIARRMELDAPQEGAT